MNITPETGPESKPAGGQAPLAKEALNDSDDAEGTPAQDADGAQISGLSVDQN